MRSRIEIENEVAALRSKLSEIDNAIKEQMGKPFFQRQSRVCMFLSIEKKAYLKALEKLNWVINE